MTNLAQFLLIVVISTLTFLIALVAIQVFHILHEARLALRKFNGLLDNTQYLSEAAARPIQSMNQFFSDVKTLVKTTENEIISDTADRVLSPSKKSTTDTSPTASGRRFFHRAGQMLRPTRPS